MTVWCYSIAWSSSAAAMPWAHIFICQLQRGPFLRWLPPVKGEKAAEGERRPQSSGVVCCLCAKPWGEGRRASSKETQTQPICKSMGCTSALRWLCWLPKQAVVSGQGRTRCHGRVGCRSSSTSPQSCTMLPECSVNC